MMKQIKIRIQFWISVLALLSLGISGYAQTVNKGELVVEDGTIFSTEAAFDNTEEGEFYNNGDTYIYSHFNNDGIVDFLGETGLTRFVGDEVQNISGNEPSYFYDVLFKNQSATNPFRLSGKINVFDNAKFVQGIVDNLNYNGTFNFRDQAIHSQTSDAGHVNGKVNYFGAFDFVYPVGKNGYYRPAKISEPGNPTAEFDGEYIFKNSDEYHSHEFKPDNIIQINGKEFWTIEERGEKADDMYVTLTWREETTPNYIIEAAQNEALTIVRWDEEAHLWTDQGGNIDLDNQTITSNPVDGFGDFTMAVIDTDKENACRVVVYNAVTPNGDGYNDFFRIEDKGQCAGIKHVKIFNRWGVKVFETNDYSENGELFYGYSNGRATINSKKQLPTGTYFYILEYDYQSDNDKTKTEKKAGYLYLSGSSGN